MSEINGLRNISSSSSLHGIEAPPQPEDFDTVAEYEAAHSAWWVRVHCWHVEVKTL